MRIKPFIVLGATALLLAACQTDEIQQNPPTDGATPLSFAMANAEWATTPTAYTRAAGINHPTMSVYGYYTAEETWSEASAHTTKPTPNLFDRQKLEYNGVDWTYHPHKFWFPTGNHHFFAFAPWGVASQINIVNGTPSLVYKVRTGAENHIDLLWALEKEGYVAGDRSSLLNQTLADYRISGVQNPLAFSFRHALTRIAFAAKVDGVKAEADRYSITSISLQNLFFEGVSEFKIDQSNGVDAVTGATWKRPVENNKQRDFLVAKGGKGLITDLKLTTNLQPITATKGAASPNNYDGYMYMIPQPIENSGQGAKPTISITLHDHTLNVDLVVKGDLISPSGHGWHSGKAITYTITYTGGGNTPFAILANVTDWEDQEVPTSIYGTYLHVSQQEVVTPPNENVKIFYSTDGSPVTGSYNGGAAQSLSLGQGSFDFVAVPGITYATITAGKLTRKIKVM